MPALLSIALLSVGFLSEDPGAPWRPAVRPAPAPGTPAATVRSQGVLGADTVRRHVQRHHPAFWHCFLQELRPRPSLVARVQVTFTIAPAGEVSAASGSGEHPELARCVAGAVRQIRFPELYDQMADGSTQLSQSSTVVTYPFVFKHQGKDRPAPAPPEPVAPEASGPRAPRTPDDAGASPPAPSPSPRPAGPPGRRSRGRSIDTRHGDDPLKGIPAGNSL